MIRKSIRIGRNVVILVRGAMSVSGSRLKFEVFDLQI